MRSSFPSGSSIMFNTFVTKTSVANQITPFQLYCENRRLFVWSGHSLCDHGHSIERGWAGHEIRRNHKKSILANKGVFLDDESIQLFRRKKMCQSNRNSSEKFAVLFKAIDKMSPMWTRPMRFWKMINMSLQRFFGTSILWHVVELFSEKDWSFRIRGPIMSI